MVSESVVKAMMELSALSFVLPLAMVIFWQIRYKKSIVPALTGALVFVTFGGLLKEIYGAMHYVQGFWLVYLRKPGALLLLNFS